ncbi:MAG: competence type IV pilus major pilin ComGC [Candidatus Saccharibacteria bacterium]
MRSKKGFTLIEMMIVIAVIAILAAVLIPRAGLVQQSAKDTGVEANSRVVIGVTSQLLPKYSDGGDLRDAIAAKLLTANLMNPATNGQNLGATAGPTISVVYSNTVPSGTAANLKGIVWLTVPDTISDGVYVNCFDNAGVLMSGYPQNIY